MKYLYFPGCSLKGTGKAYEESLLAVFRALGIELEEIDDWNCCGATAYMSVDEAKSYALAGRNLAIAEREDLDVIAPCSACYLGLNKAQKSLQDHPEIRARVIRRLKAIRARRFPTRWAYSSPGLRSPPGPRTPFPRPRGPPAA